MHFILRLSSVCFEPRAVAHEEMCICYIQHRPFHFSHGKAGKEEKEPQWKIWTPPSIPVSSWNLMNQFLFAKLTEKVKFCSLPVLTEGKLCTVPYENAIWRKEQSSATTAARWLQPKFHQSPNLQPISCPEWWSSRSSPVWYKEAKLWQNREDTCSQAQCQS